MSSATLSILVLVAIIYLIFMIFGVIFIKKKKGSFLKQTIDPKPEQHFNVKDENQNQ